MILLSSPSLLFVPFVPVSVSVSVSLSVSVSESVSVSVFVFVLVFESVPVLVLLVRVQCNRFRYYCWSSSLGVLGVLGVLSLKMVVWGMVCQDVVALVAVDVVLDQRTHSLLLMMLWRWCPWAQCRKCPFQTLFSVAASL